MEIASEVIPLLSGHLKIIRILLTVPQCCSTSLANVNSTTHIKTKNDLRHVVAVKLDLVLEILSYMHGLSHLIVMNPANHK
jgi:hypothetical protein